MTLYVYDDVTIQKLFQIRQNLTFVKAFINCFLAVYEVNICRSMTKNKFSKSSYKLVLPTLKVLQYNMKCTSIDLNLDFIQSGRILY